MQPNARISRLSGTTLKPSKHASSGGHVPTLIPYDYLATLSQEKLAFPSLRTSPATLIRQKKNPAILAIM